MKGQLTGIPRQIKDSVADLYNNVQQWIKLNAIGFEQLTKLSDIKLALIGPSSEFCKVYEGKESMYRYSDDLDKICHDLVFTFKKMEIIASELTAIVLKFQKLSELAVFNSNLGNDSNEIPFLTWPIQRFIVYAKDIAEMFNKELSVKKCIVESAAHVDHKQLSEDVETVREKSRDILMTYSSCWLHEPYINEGIKDTLIEELLYETGHSL